MDCLKIIGLRGICDAETRLVVNDLPGISLKMVSNLTDDQKASFADVWESVQNNAVNEVMADLLPHLAKYMRPDTLIDNYQTSYIDTPYQDVDASAEWKGVALEHWGSKYARFVINDVQLYADSAGSYNVKIFDYNDGRELDAFTGTLAAGLNTITINKSYDIQGQKKRLFIAYDGTSINSKKTAMLPYSFTNIQGGKVALATTPIRENIDFGSNTFGLSVNFNLECSLELFACQYRELLKQALWYKHGDSLLMFRLASDRINQYTLVGTEQAKELRELYHAKYEKSLNAVLDSISAKAGDDCFICDNQRTFKYNLP